MFNNNEDGQQHSETGTPHFPVILKDNANNNDTDLYDGAKKILTKIRPQWNFEKLAFQVFTDGLTNKVLCCRETYGSERILMRIYGENTHLIIDRSNEKSCMKLLSDNGLAPPLYCTFDNGLAYGFVPGVVLDVDTIREKHMSALVARRMAQLHTIKRKDGENNNNELQPCIFFCIEKFLRVIPERFDDRAKQEKFENKFIDRSKILQEIAFLKSHFAKLNEPLVFCHNDLLLKNIIYDAEKDCATFIDFEYAGVNYRSFDIANHFAEFAGTDDIDFSRVPDSSFQRWWITQYLESYNQFTNRAQPSTSDIEELNFRVRSSMLAPHFFWSVWAVVQAQYSNIDFDYLEYAILRMDEYFRLKNEILKI